MLFDWLLGFPWFPPANRPTAATALSPGESDGFLRAPPVRFSGEGILVEPFQILGATAAVRALSVGAPVCILMGIFFSISVAIYCRGFGTTIRIVCFFDVVFLGVRRLLCWWFSGVT